jgi:ribosomal protein L16 Arg81 hydroxylase
MPEKSFDFDALLAPLAAQAFFSTHWEREHLLVHRRQENYYRSLITAADLENLISHSDARYPAIRLAKGGGYFAPEVYTRDIKHGDESFLGVPDVKRIAEEYRRGATVALPAIHRTWKPLGLLCDALRERFDHPAHANAYITPGNAAGFTPHYDVHEVFVLQIAGRKRWSIYSPVIPLPHRSQPFTPQAYAGQAPMAQVDLEAGDLLYLPRGFLHSTTTSDSYSAHVTVGITVYTWVDLVKEFLASAVEDPQLRGALPAGFASRGELSPLLRQKMLASLDRLRSASNLEQLVDGFTARVRAAQVRRPEPFRADETVIGPDSVLQMPEQQSYRITQEADKTFLEFNGVRYQLPEPVAATLNAMTALDSLTPQQLPDHLDMEARLGLLRHLSDIGFLKVLRKPVP